MMQLFTWTGIAIFQVDALNMLHALESQCLLCEAGWEVVAAAHYWQCSQDAASEVSELQASCHREFRSYKQ